MKYFVLFSMVPEAIIVLIIWLDPNRLKTTPSLHKRTSILVGLFK